MKWRRDQGFTLVELLVVVVVLGILAAIVLFALASPAQLSFRTACRSDAHTVELAQEARHIQFGTYANDMSGLVPVYMRTVPGNITHYLITTDSGGTVFVAQAPAGAPVASSATPSPCNSIA